MKKQIRRFCLCCRNKKIKKIVDLGYHSFADRFIPRQYLKKKDPKYPLILDICPECKFIQSRYITDPRKRYSELDYSYTSSNSFYSKNHWIKFAEELNRGFNVSKKKIFEIGSNDGFLIQKLKKMKADVLGIDASNFMVKLSNKKVRTIKSIFSLKESLNIKKKFGKANIIIANNVFNHSNNPKNFLKGVKNLMDKNSVFIFEQPYFASGLYACKFDQIYHEHVSYFTAQNIKSIIDKTGFKIISMNLNDYHGGSLRTVVAKKKSIFPKKNNIKFIKTEKIKKIYNLKFYKKLFQKININKIKLINKIVKYKKNGYTISGIGAGAKSNTFLTYYGLNNKFIDFLTDTSIYKKNKFTPLTRIPIKDDNELKKFNKLICIILSWNIGRIVINKIKKINNKMVIIKTR